jgi:L-2-hydroxycarboxylate dehydrogenase (NAD+)
LRHFLPRNGQGRSQGKARLDLLFSIIHPEAMHGRDYAFGRSQAENVRACLQDILGPGNEKCLLPGELEAKAAKLTDAHGGLLFTKAEIESFAHITDELGEPAWNPEDFKTITL